MGSVCQTLAPIVEYLGHLAGRRGIVALNIAGDVVEVLCGRAVQRTRIRSAIWFDVSARLRGVNKLAAVRGRNSTLDVLTETLGFFKQTQRGILQQMFCVLTGIVGKLRKLHFLFDCEVYFHTPRVETAWGYIKRGCAGGGLRLPPHSVRFEARRVRHSRLPSRSLPLAGRRCPLCSPQSIAVMHQVKMQKRENMRARHEGRRERSLTEWISRLARMTRPD